MCSLLGIGLPMGATAESCGKSENPISQGDKVIIIGAGAGGLTAGYLLQQRNIDFEILEASSLYGGRMKRTKDFADFPIPLGGEWLHVGTEVLREIVNDASIHVDVTTIPYDPNLDFGLLEGKQISIEDAGFTTDQKFINSSWFDFFEEYIVSSIQNRIRYNNVIESIDYSGSRIVVKSATEEFIADRVIVSVPVKILQ
ncbi:MAG: FAD-dependent oxidoreductase [Saprospiraceae bacterium]|nr:FAD-dependent oxidoreductase [Saprospiraceae bacterium]